MPITNCDILCLIHGFANVWADCIDKNIQQDNEFPRENIDGVILCSSANYTNCYIDAQSARHSPVKGTYYYGVYCRIMYSIYCSKWNATTI